MGGIDLNHLEKYVCGDVALRTEILGLFEEQMRTLLSTLNIKAVDQDWHDLMHAMKGAARGVGAWTLGEVCEKGEGLIGERTENFYEERTALAAELCERAAQVAAEAQRLREAA